MKHKNKSENPNRDPITREPGSHPVGTGSGALVGGAAGAALGAPAGPVGSAVGAGVGAVAGGLGGKAAGEAMNPTRSSELGRYIDYTVVDRDGSKVGTVDAVWEDQSGQPYYLAIRTGWLHMGKAHVIPAHDSQVDETRRRIKLPFDSDLIKNAPAFARESELTEDSHRSIGEYFGLRRHSPDSAESCATKDTENQEEANLTLKEEEVKVGKRRVEYGGIRLKRIVRTEQVKQPVDLDREEIVIERTPVAAATMSASNARFSDEDIYIPLRREEPIVEKSVRETEQIRVGKRHETDHEEISETRRREDVELENDRDRDRRFS
jgi:uncharacterized protein (TIGR02271 family)